MIVAQDVIYDYPAARALKGVSFVVPRGSVLALVGPNGAGKSTLMRCIAALDRPTSGTIRVAGLDTEADPRAVHAAIRRLPPRCQETVVLRKVEGLSLREISVRMNISEKTVERHLTEGLRSLADVLFGETKPRAGQ